MSSKVKGIAEIELKSDRFTGPANKAKTSLEQLGSKGKAAIAKIGPAANKAKSTLTTLGQQGKSSIDKIGQAANQTKTQMSTMAQSASTSMGQVGRSATLAGSQVTQSGVRGTAAYNQLGIAGQRAGSQISVGMVQAASSTRQMTVATQQASVSMGVMTLGIAALGTSIGTTFTGMSNLNKAHLKQGKAIQKVEKVTVGLARANDLLSSTQLAVRRFTLSIATMEEKGLQATDAYTISKANLALQLQKLGTAQDDYAVKLKDIELAELDALQIADDLQDTYINMTISIANTVLMSAFLAKTLVPNLSKAWIINKVHILANTRAMVFFRGTIIKSIFNLKMFKISMIGATFGFRGLTIGVRAFMLALGPLGIAMIAIGALWTLWETNAFGFRDALIELWKWLKKILPILFVMEAAVKHLFPPATEAVEDLGEATKETTAEMEGLTDTVGDLDVDLKAGLIPDLETLETGFVKVTRAADKAGDQLDKFKKKRKDLSQAASEDQSESFADTLFGLNGIFSQTGRFLGGFRGKGLLITKPGTRQAVAVAMERFGISREAAERLTQTTIEARSRVLTKLPTPQGGGVGAAVLAFIKGTGGTVANRFTGGNFANLGFAIGKSAGGGPGVQGGAKIASEDVQRNRLRTGGIRVAGLPLSDPRSVIGGFTSISAMRSAAKMERSRLRHANAVLAGFYGFRARSGQTQERENARFMAGVRRLLAEAGLPFKGPNARSVAGAGIAHLARARAIIERRREERTGLIAGFAPKFGFTVSKIKDVASALFGGTFLTGGAFTTGGLFKELQFTRRKEFFAKAGVLKTGVTTQAEAIFGIPLNEILRNDALLRDLNNMLRFANHERYAVVST